MKQNGRKKRENETKRQIRKDFKKYAKNTNAAEEFRQDRKSPNSPNGIP